MKLNNSIGSTLVETLAMAGLLLVFALGSAHFLKTKVTEIWLENELYQILICVNEGKTAQDCKSRTNAKAHTLPWDQPNFQVHVKKMGPITEGVLIWKNGRKTIRLDLEGKIQKVLPLLGLLTTIPLILIFCVGVTLWLASIRDTNFVSSRCRYQTLLSQEKMGRLLSSLLDLNPEAKRLRMARKLAEHELRIAKITAQPEAILIAEAQLATVLASQTALRLQQERLLFQARESRFRSKVLFNSDTLGVQGKGSLENFGTMGLAVSPTPSNDATPDYILRPDFEKQQKLTLKWQFQIFARVPSWLRSFMSDETSRGICAATLKKEVGLWRARLVAVK